MRRHPLTLLFLPPILVVGLPVHDNLHDVVLAPADLARTRDYCVQEDADGPPLDSTAGGSGTNLAECAGDCDNDDDCQDGLTCFQRSGYTLVPGCTGSGTSSWDYCIAS